MNDPIAIDIDGTLTREDGSLDSRALEKLYNLKNLVVIVTGKILPNAEVLCRFAGLKQRVVAENGGVIFVDDELEITIEGERPRKVAEQYKKEGYSMGWGEYDLPNRWRETEVVVNRSSPLKPLEDIAKKYGMKVVDTGYAYHVKSPKIDKGTGLKKVANKLGIDIKDFIAIGDSENDVPVFNVVGMSYAVANSSEKAKKAADVVTNKKHAEGFLEAIEKINKKTI